MTQAEYEAACLAWGTNEYRPAYRTDESGTYPAPPPLSATGADWAIWLDKPDGYRAWYDGQPNQSGSNSPPPPPPRKKKN